MIDFPEVCNLIKKYLNYHKDNIHIEYELHDSSMFGSDIEDENLYFISNYCFTEIHEEYRQKYVSSLFNRVKDGFILWQNNGVSIENIPKYISAIYEIEPEKPNTCLDGKNYHVFFRS
jgi:hypothetical protein